ncbi:tyrosine-type recombinase/integrase [Akkermansiaceae bacterium]|nr:tyrosine-type recombinase/integrase [Akkermansiaceae bacterium]MDA7528966.1 tyrosine-type recombinase/integrase [Akkermansiaceae bacterium]MDA7616648.1 tyrosine-type recombinase/integrase [bacterium]MDB4749009.1 tyrosine-type recombinase/integrase [Akkermansiaceae bacterium]
MPVKKKNQNSLLKGATLKGGVRVGPWRHSNYSWRVSYFTGEGSRRKRIQKGFETKRDAMKWAKEVEKGLIAHGRLDHEITRKERQAVIAFREIIARLPVGVETSSLVQIVEDYQRLIDGRRYSILVSDLIDEYLGSLSAKNLSQKYVDTMRHRLLRFDGDFGGRLACEITTESVEDWLQRLGLADVSVNHFRAALQQLFNYALKLKVISENPINEIAKLKTEANEIGVLSPTQAESLLHHSPEEIRASIAIGLFAGLRRSEISRMSWGEIDLEQGFIEVKAKNSKSAARRLIEIRPCLREWLIPLWQRSGGVMPTEMVYRNRLEKAKKSAGITEWPNNALRHSFASYHLAAFQDASALALEMGHSTTRMIFEHYRALVTRSAGESYWQIMPVEDKKIFSIV